MTKTDEIFEFILMFKRSHDGNSPTLDEIARSNGLHSKSMATLHRNRLVLAGRIRLSGAKYTTRRIEVVGGEWRMKPEAK